MVGSDSKFPILIKQKKGNCEKRMQKFDNIYYVK